MMLSVVVVVVSGRGHGKKLSNFSGGLGGSAQQSRALLGDEIDLAVGLGPNLPDGGFLDALAEIGLLLVFLLAECELVGRPFLKRLSTSSRDMKARPAPHHTSSNVRAGLVRKSPIAATRNFPIENFLARLILANVGFVALPNLMPGSR
jgi:hypothetical protein